MQIKFSQSFKDISEKELGITKEDVIQTIKNPLRKQLILFDGLDILAVIRKEEKTNSYILVIAQRKDDTLHIRSSCFRILHDLIEMVGTNEPIVLLQQLALNFGYILKIGERKGKFFFRERIPVPRGYDPAKIIEIISPKKIKANLITTLFFKIEEGFVETAMVFSIELNSYLSWIKGKAKTQVSAKVYDVFISYKRNTAKDFAVHLKSCLTETGFRTFLDLTDIPKEFSSTSTWFDVRNAAILNTRRFLLIITVGIESSVEVAKEVFLARKVKGIKFMYLRHKDIEPQILLEYEGKEINLGEGNQVEFGTKEDLARKVLITLKRE